MSVSLVLSLGQPPPAKNFLLPPPFPSRNPNPNILLSSPNCNRRSVYPNFPHRNVSFPSLFSNPNANLYNGSNNGNNNNNNGGRNRWWFWSNEGDDSFESEDNWSSLLPLILVSIPLLSFPAIAAALSNGGVWEVRGGKWTRLVPDTTSDSFVVVDSNKGYEYGKEDSSNFYLPLVLESCWRQSRDLFLNLMLPEGYPDSVSSDYMQYSLWRGLQGIASQISGVLATQSLLYAVGLGKGAIPAAAAVNWVLKDGIGYLSKILLSNFGRHFDVNPKGWRLFADLLENAAYGMEIITPAFPQFFVLIGAAAGAGRSAATLIQSATRSCFFAGFAVQRNSAEVIAKGEAQGMVSKFFGIMLGIALANHISSSTPLALASFSVVTGFHMYCNLKSYQSIQLRTLNPYRASLVFSEYLLTGQVPQVKEVNDEEPFYPGLPFVNLDTYTESFGTLSAEARNAAADICRRLHLGCKLSEVVKNKEDAFAVFDLFRDEGYILAENRGKFCVVLQEGSSPQDMLKSLFHINYLYWLERNVPMESTSIVDECKTGGRLQISLEYVRREFGHIKSDGLQNGWLTEDGLIARPSPNRIRLGYAETDLTN